MAPSKVARVADVSPQAVRSWLRAASLPQPKCINEVVGIFAGANLWQFMTGVSREEIMDIRLDKNTPEYAGLIALKVIVLRNIEGLTRDGLSRKISRKIEEIPREIKKREQISGVKVGYVDISNCEDGQLLSPDKMKAIAIALGLTYEELLGETECETPIAEEAKTRRQFLLEELAKLKPLAVLIKRIFIEQLDKAMGDEGITQEEVARELGVTVAAVSSWLRAKSSPNLERICKRINNLKNIFLETDFWQFMTALPREEVMSIRPDEIHPGCKGRLIGLKMVVCRFSLGMTLDEVSYFSGMEVKKLWYYEGGYIFMAAEELRETFVPIADALSITYEELVGGLEAGRNKSRKKWVVC